MQRSFVVGVVIVCLVLGGRLPCRGAEGAEREADHAALRGLMARITEGVSAANLQALDGCFARDFIYVAVDQTLVTNRVQLAAYFDRMRQPASPVASVKIEPQAEIGTQFLGPDSGYCSGSSVDTYTLKGGRVFRIPSRWTAVVVREGGDWRVRVVHLGVNFVNNPVLTASSLSFWEKLGIFLHLKKPPYERPS